MPDMPTANSPDPPPQPGLQFGDHAQVSGPVVGGNVGQVITNVTQLTQDQSYDVAGLPNPYLGLRSFTYAERALFAGRDAVISQTIARLSLKDDRFDLDFYLASKIHPAPYPYEHIIYASWLKRIVRTDVLPLISGSQDHYRRGCADLPST